MTPCDQVSSMSDARGSVMRRFVFYSCFKSPAKWRSTQPPYQAEGPNSFPSVRVFITGTHKTASWDGIIGVRVGSDSGDVRRRRLLWLVSRRQECGVLLLQHFHPYVLGLLASSYQKNFSAVEIWSANKSHYVPMQIHQLHIFYVFIACAYPVYVKCTVQSY